MKRLLLFLCLGWCLTSCSLGKCTDWVVLKSYVTDYMESEGLQAGASSMNDVVIYMGPANETAGLVYYHSPDISDRQLPEKFLEVALRNGDRGYHKETCWSPEGTTLALAENFKEIHIICTNAAWDDAHPAGTLLNDLINMEFISYGEFVKSGYVAENTIWKKRKPMTELSELDLRMLYLSFQLYFDSHPSTGKYEMTVTLVTTEEEHIERTCTFDFDAVDAE